MEASVLLHSGKLISPNESTNKKNNMGKISASGKEIYSSKTLIYVYMYKHYFIYI